MTADDQIEALGSHAYSAAGTGCPAP
jgi:hypothetical protein